MANREKMFQVIVIGGMSLIAPLAAQACGGATAPVLPGDEIDSGSRADTGTRPIGQDAGTFDTGFPQEGPARFDSGFPSELGPPPAFDSGFPVEGPALMDSGFPQDGPAQIDSGFPQEGPVAPDASFPNETATVFDSGKNEQ